MLSIASLKLVRLRFNRHNKILDLFFLFWFRVMSWNKYVVISPQPLTARCDVTAIDDQALDLSCIFIKSLQTFSGSFHFILLFSKVLSWSVKNKFKLTARDIIITDHSCIKHLILRRDCSLPDLLPLENKRREKSPEIMSDATRWTKRRVIYFTESCLPPLRVIVHVRASNSSWSAAYLNVIQ